MQRRVPMIATEDAGAGDGRILLRSPEVGCFTHGLPRESLLGPGASGGTILTLGESIELIGPKMRTHAFVVGTPKNDDGEALTVIQPNARVRLSLPEQARPGDMLRRETETKKET